MDNNRAPNIPKAVRVGLSRVGKTALVRSAQMSAKPPPVRRGACRASDRGCSDRSAFLARYGLAVCKLKARRSQT